jgi:hypothetical protein
MLKVLMLCATLLVVASSTVEARLCIPNLGPWYDECDPSNGEPPSWCSDYPDGSWLMDPLQAAREAFHDAVARGERAVRGAIENIRGGASQGK